jgi:hypothetical protein
MSTSWGLQRDVCHSIDFRSTPVQQAEGGGSLLDAFHFERLA